jgi:hypothetical protein
MLPTPLDTQSEGEAILSDPMQAARSRRGQDSDALIQGLTPEELQLLAEKVYKLLQDEMRIEAERHGRTLRR